MNKDKIYLTVIVLLAIALIVGCALQAQQTSKRLSVSEIIIPEQGLIFKTEDGKVIAKMTVTKDGGSLGIFNNQGKAVAWMRSSVTENGGVLGICNNQEKLVAVVSASENGGVLGIYNNQGELAAWMTASNYSGLLCIFDNRGKLIWSKP